MNEQLRANYAEQVSLRQKLRENPAENEIPKLQSELTKLENRHLELLEEQGAKNTPTELLTKVKFRNFIKGLMKRKLTGAEAEYGQELKLGDNELPWGALLTDAEKSELVRERADAGITATSSQSGISQRAIAARIFKRSDAAFLGVEFPAVPAGQARWPVISQTGASGAVKAADASQDTEALTLTAKTLEPVRATAAYRYTHEQLNLFGMELEERLRQDLRDTLTTLIDDQIINGSGTAPEPTGILKQTSFFPADKTGSKAEDAEAILGVITDGIVDALTTYDLKGVKMMVNKDIYSYMIQSFRGTNSDTSALEILQRHGIMVRVSSRIPAIDMKNGSVVLCSPMGVGNLLYAPLWNNRIIFDELSGAQSGQIKLTALSLFNFSAVRTLGLKGAKIQTAV